VHNVDRAFKVARNETVRVTREVWLSNLPGPMYLFPSHYSVTPGVQPHFQRLTVLLRLWYIDQKALHFPSQRQTMMCCR
jgi:hypothetical protein